MLHFGSNKRVPVKNAKMVEIKATPLLICFSCILASSLTLNSASILSLESKRGFISCHHRWYSIDKKLKCLSQNIKCNSQCHNKVWFTVSDRGPTNFVYFLNKPVHPISTTQVPVSSLSKTHQPKIIFYSVLAPFKILKQRGNRARSVL